MQPLVFEPLFMERVWGGRRLETLFHKHLPSGERIGESWEIVDREDAQSVVHEGPLQGATLHELWTQHRAEIFGPGLPDTARFPLLCKILDAQDRLSVQVHPPAEVAARFGGEPKTEMWYLADALLDSDIYVGLQPGVTRDTFEHALREGRAADLVHRIPVRTGDAFFLPSGRIHAIGAGNVLIEVQQNSDTTYRVFDWNRLGLDGRPRQLHIEESLASIDFTDYEPAPVVPRGEILVECADFRVEKWTLTEPRPALERGFAIFAVVSGGVECAGRAFRAGDFFIVPASVADADLQPADGEATVLRTTIPAS